MKLDLANFRTVAANLPVKGEICDITPAQPSTQTETDTEFVSLIQKVIGLYDYGEASGRIGTQTVANIDNVAPLQAADILAYEMARAQRADRPERYPFKRMQEAAKAGQLQMTIKWGDIRAARPHRPA